MVPERLVGVWQRTPGRIGREPSADPELVVWLQTPSTFADLTVRAPADDSPAEASAGTTHSDGVVLRRDRELDWHDSCSPTDESHVEWDGQQIIERGTHWTRNADGRARCVEYEHHWDPIPSEGPVVTLDGRSSGAVAIHVRIGPWALTLARGSTRFGAHLERPGEPVLDVGDPDLARCGPGHPGWTWTERDPIGD